MAKQLVQFVGRNETTDRLYERERKAADSVKRAARELLGVKRHAGLVETTEWNCIAETLAMLAEMFSHTGQRIEVHVFEEKQPPADEGCPALEKVLP